MYDLLGRGAERALWHAWGVNYAARTVAEALSALWAAAAALFVLDRLDSRREDSPVDWLQRHLDVLSVQATLFDGFRRDFAERVAAHMAFTGDVGTLGVGI